MGQKLKMGNFYGLSDVTLDLIMPINKIIFNVGTNDIRYERFGTTKYQEPVNELIGKARNYFPQAMIYIVPVLPMKNMYRYTVDNVLSFNEILKRAASLYSCEYVDCSGYFLSDDWRDINKSLYCWDGLHLNARGLHLLGTWIYRIIFDFY